MHISDKRLINALIFLFCVVLFLFPAFYNGFPLVTSDTGTYIDSGFKMVVPDDRPICYGIFILLTSLKISLWGPLFAQSILLVFFLYLVVRHLTKDNYSHYMLLALVLATVMGTSAGWNCSQLMADSVTPILLLAVYTLYYIPVKKNWLKIVLYIFIWGFVIMHNAHLVMTLVIAVLSGVYYWLKKNKELVRKSVILLAISISGFLTASTLNAISGKGFRPSNSSHVFIMCRMVESGIMDAFLNDYCPTENYKLCAYKDSLPLRQWDFQWDANSPLYKTGGWQANEEEYNKIIHKTLTRPKYIGMHVLKSAEATLRELPQVNVGDGLSPQGKDSNPYWKVLENFPAEVKEYLSSLQNTGNLHFDFFNVVILLVAFISLVVALIIGIIRGQTKDSFIWQRAFGFTVLFIVVNAFATATFSTPLGRFNARVFWVLPCLCFLYIFNHILTVAKTKKLQQTTPQENI